MEDTLCDSVTPVAILLVASLKVQELSAAVKAPGAGTLPVVLVPYDTVTVGLADPLLNSFPVNESVKPVIVLPVLFFSCQVAFALLADPLPKKDKLLFPYHPPAVPLVWLLPV
jgi:hypothetical protein